MKGGEDGGSVGCVSRALNRGAIESGLWVSHLLDAYELSLFQVVGLGVIESGFGSLISWMRMYELSRADCFRWSGLE